MPNQDFRYRKQKETAIDKKVEIAPVQADEKFNFSVYYKKLPLLSEANAPPATLAGAYKLYLQKLLMDDRVSTAVNYHRSYVSPHKFAGNVLLETVTSDLLKRYERQAVMKGISKSTGKAIPDEEDRRFPKGMVVHEDSGFQGHAQRGVVIRRPHKNPKAES